MKVAQIHISRINSRLTNGDLKMSTLVHIIKSLSYAPYLSKCRINLAYIWWNPSDIDFLVTSY